VDTADTTFPAARKDPLDIALSHLRDMIATAAASGKRRLPAERELAGAFGVSRAAVRKAFDILEAENLVRRHVGRGTFAIGSAARPAAEPNDQTISGFALTAAGVSPRDLIDARFVVEPAIAELAATSARPADIEDLRRCLAKRATANDAETYEMWDYSLHMAIAKATHNVLLVDVLERIHRLRRSIDWQRYRATTLVPTRKRLSDVQHEAIVDALARHDPRAATEAMRAHILTIRRFLLGEAS
jgi:DNA-binding FadR family transcriptional regulator